MGVAAWLLWWLLGLSGVSAGLNGPPVVSDTSSVHQQTEQGMELLAVSSPNESPQRGVHLPDLFSPAGRYAIVSVC